MVRYLHKQCAASGWFNPEECDNSSNLGVMIQLENQQFAVHPPTLSQSTFTAFELINPPVGFAMASDITASVFRQMSPYQTELVLQPRGIRIPIIDNLDGIARLVTPNFKKSYSCIVKRERLVLVWASNVESILRHGAEIEKLLLEIVRIATMQ